VPSADRQGRSPPAEMPRCKLSPACGFDYLGPASPVHGRALSARAFPRRKAAFPWHGQGQRWRTFAQGGPAAPGASQFLRRPCGWAVSGAAGPIAPGAWS
jgi:hypothetical protein